MDSVLKLSEIATWGMSKIVAEIFFIIIGIVFILVGLKALADKVKYQHPLFLTEIQDMT